MNTDNMNVTGETFDFGPYRFLPYSDPSFTAAYFDQTSLYAFGRQPSAALWNLQQLAGAMTLVGEAEALSEALATYETRYQTSLCQQTLGQLGLRTGDLAEDLEFLQILFSWMTNSQIPWSQFFFDWFGGKLSQSRAGHSPAHEHYTTQAFEPVKARLLTYEADRPDRMNHAYFQQARPESLLIDEIEAIWDPIAKADDWSLFEDKLERLSGKRKALLGKQG